MSEADVANVLSNHVLVCHIRVVESSTTPLRGIAARRQDRCSSVGALQWALAPIVVANPR